MLRKDSDSWERYPAHNLIATPIELVVTFPKLGNRGVSSDGNVNLQKLGIFMALVIDVSLCGRDSGIARGIGPRVLNTAKG